MSSTRIIGIDFGTGTSVEAQKQHKKSKCQTMKEIKASESQIDSFRDKYDFLSNFYPCPIEYQGVWYQNAEAAFQAQKCRNEEEKTAFCGLPAAKAKRRGRQVLLRSDWESVKFQLMEEIIRVKFNQNPKLAEKLLATGDRQLIEGNEWGDTCWGVDMRTGEGDNHLGKILMKVRSELYDVEKHKIRE